MSDESYLSTETLEALTAATKAAHQGMKKPRATTTTTVKVRSLCFSPCSCFPTDTDLG